MISYLPFPVPTLSLSAVVLLVAFVVEMVRSLVIVEVKAVVTSRVPIYGHYLRQLRLIFS